MSGPTFGNPFGTGFGSPFRSAFGGAVGGAVVRGESRPHIPSPYTPPASIPTTSPLSIKRSTAEFRQSLTDVIVEIQCGQPPVKYRVHKHMLCAASGYFRAAFSCNFKEGQERCLKLVDEDPDILVIVLHTIYAEKLMYDDPVEELGAVNKAIDDMIKVYIACDKYYLPAYKPPVLAALTRYLDVLQFKLCTGLAYGYITLVYNNTTEGSALREFVTRRTARAFLGNPAGMCVDKTCVAMMGEIPDFAADMLKTLVRAAGMTYDNPLSWPLEEPKPSEGTSTSV